MTKTRISHPSKTLTAEGFIASSTRKVAGCPEAWTHTDGRKVRIGYCLFSRTGQSSRGAAADWGYVRMEEGR